MTPSPTPQALTAAHTFFEWGRIQTNSDWILPLLIFAALVLAALGWYRREGDELPAVLRVVLPALRVLALLGLLVIYLKPQWRTERDVTTNSRVILLADTSLSMGLPEDSVPSTSGGPSRADRLVQAVSEGELLDRLRATHEVVVARFDQQSGTIATLPKRSTAGSETAPSAAQPAAASAAAPLDWASELAPRGAETRLGQALRQVLNEERANPLSGVIVVSDGGQNAGIGPTAAAALAREAGVLVHAIGLGSDRQPANVRLSDLIAPARAFPGDSYTVTGYVQAQGLSAHNVTVELYSRPADDSARQQASAPEQLESVAEVALGGEGEVVPVKFELTPTAAGRRTLRLRVEAPAGDSNPNDNSQQVDIEVVDRKTRVLLYASGPTREYRFLDALLFRDRNMQVDVLLETAQAGISQEAHEILDAFPGTREELDQYDCLVAFDPNWEALDAARIDLVERWVGERAGGLIVIPGPVYADTWLERPNLAKIRDLYPVEFQRRFTLLDDQRAAAPEPWPLDFTREGREADFLWLGDSAAASQQAWDSFTGVYGYYAVRGPKPAATVYANFSDPRAAKGGEKPVYFCGQFYGSGRVFYLGSGEMWRLRGVDPAYFDQFYTKLIRHVSQGRLLRGSSRGVLLTERDRYVLGQAVAVRAQLNNAQLEPLDLPSVRLEVFLPDNTLQHVELVADPTRLGTFAGQFVVRQEGVWRLELPLPDGADERGANERLVRRIQVKVPDLERENPERNDPLLSELATSTGGRYYVGFEAALGLRGQPPLWKALPDRSRTMPISEAPRPLWDNWQWMCVVCGCLSLEWLLRRWFKLA